MDVSKIQVGSILFGPMNYTIYIIERINGNKINYKFFRDLRFESGFCSRSDFEDYEILNVNNKNLIKNLLNSKDFIGFIKKLDLENNQDESGLY